MTKVLKFSRCLITGTCSAVSRFSSMLGSFVVEHSLYYNYPTGIAIALYLIGIVVTFLVPEPDTFKLTNKTRTKKKYQNQEMELQLC